MEICLLTVVNFCFRMRPDIGKETRGVHFPESMPGHNAVFRAVL